MQGNPTGEHAGGGDGALTAATLRDGLLQDLIAISIMLKDVGRSLSPGEESESLLRRASITLEDDLAGLRQLIRTLEETGRCGRDRGDA